MYNVTWDKYKQLVGSLKPSLLFPMPCFTMLSAEDSGSREAGEEARIYSVY